MTPLEEDPPLDIVREGLLALIPHELRSRDREHGIELLQREALCFWDPEEDHD